VHRVALVGGVWRHSDFLEFVITHCDVGWGKEFARYQGCDFE